MDLNLESTVEFEVRYWSTMGDSLTALLRIHSGSGSTQIWSTDSMDEARGLILLSEIASTSWRDTCRTLVSLQDGRLVVDSLVEVKIERKQPADYTQDLYLLSWIDVEGRLPHGGVRDFLLELDDDVLKKLHRQEGTFLDVAFIDAVSDLLNTMDDYHVDLKEILDNAHLDGTRAILGQLQESLARMIKRVDLEAEFQQQKRAEVLRPFERTIQDWTEKIVGPSPCTFGAGLAHQHKRQRIRASIEDYVITMGTLPAGNHRIESVGVVDFGSLPTSGLGCDEDENLNDSTTANVTWNGKGSSMPPPPPDDPISSIGYKVGGSYMRSSPPSTKEEESNDNSSPSDSAPNPDEEMDRLLFAEMSESVPRQFGKIDEPNPTAVESPQQSINTDHSTKINTE